MKLFKANFNAAELDRLLARWLTGKLSVGEQNEWNQVLAYDSKFREEFCDFIKAMRDPGWSRSLTSEHNS